jgi:excisionase family DNA binding protein
MPIPRVYTVHEIAQILQMHEETVRALLRSGQLKGIKLGPHATLAGRFEWRITEDALRMFLGLADEAGVTERESATPAKEDA